MRRGNSTAVVALSTLLVSACVTTIVPPTIAEQEAADYGAPPLMYKAAIGRYFDSTLKDPRSIQYDEITEPTKGFFQTRAPIISGGRVTARYGWLVKATINARNSYGGYVGFKTYSFLFRGEDLIDILQPPNESN